MRATAPVFPPAANAVSLIGRLCHLSRGAAAPHRREWLPSRLIHLVACGNLAVEGPRARPRIQSAIVMLRVGFATHTPYSAPVRNRGIDHVQFRRPRHAIPFGARAHGGARTAPGLRCADRPSSRGGRRHEETGWRTGAAVQRGRRLRHARDRKPAVVPGELRGRLRHRLQRYPRIRRPGARLAATAGAGGEGAGPGAYPHRRYRSCPHAARAPPHGGRRRPLRHRRNRDRARSRHRHLQRVLSPPPDRRQRPRRHQARLRPSLAPGVRARKAQG